MSNKDNAPVKDYSHKVLTIPNMLSLLRLLLIPVVVIFFFAFDTKYYWTGLVLLISYLTDFFDGQIARRYNMISEFGKALDPIADKLTQMAVLICLVIKVPRIHILLVLLVLKEFISGLAMLKYIKAAGMIEGADWHGKLTTILLYATMLIHLIWAETLPDALSWVLIGVCAAMMVLSFILYMFRNLRGARRALEQKEAAEKTETA